MPLADVIFKLVSDPKFLAEIKETPKKIFTRIGMDEEEFSSLLHIVQGKSFLALQSNELPNGAESYWMWAEGSN